MHNQENTSTNMRSDFLRLSSILSIILFFLKSASCNQHLDSNSREILRLHRKYRQDLVDCKVDGQPPAEYMSPLKWNYDLATEAQTLANKCTLQLGLPLSNDFLCVGQNIAIGSTIKLGVDAWFNEHKLYKYDKNNYKRCLQYTQMVWADTTDIGCGVASCRMYGLSIVCRYGSSINWNNKQPYKVKSRELCPKEQNIPKDSFQTMRDDTQREPLSIVNINKLSTTGSSGSRVLHNRLNSRCISLKNLQNNRIFAPNIWKDSHYFSKGNRGGRRYVYTQRQQIGSKILF